MNEKMIRDTLGKIVPTPVQKEKMLDAIIADETGTKRRHPYKTLPYVVAAALVLFFTFTLYELPGGSPHRPPRLLQKDLEPLPPSLLRHLLNSPHSPNRRKGLR